MIPGKQYKPEDFLQIAWRHRWIIVTPLVIGAVVAFFYSRSIPDRYKSEATVLVVPPQVPLNVVRSTVNQPLKERLELMRRQILSQARLEHIIQELNLYPKERRTMLMDQVVELMRDDIDVGMPKTRRREDPNHFTVSYQSQDPQNAVLVAERLASLFVRENMQGRNVQTDATIQFLQSQVDDHLRQMQDMEKRLEVLKKDNAGRLPTQVETNLQLMQSTRQEIQSLSDEIVQERNRRINVDRTLAEELSLDPVSGGRSGAGQGEQQPRAAQQLASAKAALETLRLRLKDDHPDVKIARIRIAELERRAEAESLQQPLGGGGVALTPAEAERQKRLARLRGELENIDRSIKTKEGKLQRAQGNLADREKKVQEAPAVAAQMDDLMRGYGALKLTYEQLQKKLQEARLSASVEERQVGEQLRIIDPARRPVAPFSPNRLRMNIIGAVLGLAFGLAIAGLLEYRDTSLRTSDDVVVALALPVLALVPTMRTPSDGSRFRRRRLLLFGSSGAAVLLLTLAAVAWRLRLFESWSR